MLINHDIGQLLLIAFAGLYAGAQNALAGGGSFITFPALLLLGLNPLAANITSCVALFANQITTALVGRKHASGIGKLSLTKLFIISICGGIIGAILLLNTPVSVFSLLVPWLVLIATLIFAWGSFRKKNLQAHNTLAWYWLALSQLLIAVYGGYFGGGIGILMLAALTLAGQQVRIANATKNVLAMAMNFSAVSLFMFSQQIDWLAALALGFGAIFGGVAGSWLSHRLPEKIMRGFVILVGLSLSVWLFWK